MFLCNNRFWGSWSLCFKKSSCGCSRGISKPSYCRKWCPGTYSRSKKCFKASELGSLYQLWLKKLWTWCIRILLTSLNSNGLIGLAVLLPRWDCRITQQGSVHLGRTAYVYGAPPNPSQIFFSSAKKKNPACRSSNPWNKVWIHCFFHSIYMFVYAPFGLFSSILEWGCFYV